MVKERVEVVGRGGGGRGGGSLLLGFGWAELVGREHRNCSLLRNLMIWMVTVRVVGSC